MSKLKIKDFPSYPKTFREVVKDEKGREHEVFITRQVHHNPSYFPREAQKQ